MSPKFYVFLFSIFLWSRAFGETHYLLVNPGGAAEMNFYRYYNDVRQGYETLNALGKDVVVISGDGKWDLHTSANIFNPPQRDDVRSSFYLTKNGKNNPATTDHPTYPPVSGPFRVASDVSGAIEKMNLKDGDSVVIFITPHGDLPSNIDDGSRAVLKAWHNDVSYPQLQKVLKTISPKVKLKFVDTACFGGAIHFLSRHISNVCSVSVTNQYTESQPGSWYQSVFAKAFWEEIYGAKSTTTFAKASLEGLRIDFANGDLGSLSSSDYVDYVLKKGPYSSHGKLSGEPIYNYKYNFARIEPPEHYETVIGPDDKLLNALVTSPSENRFNTGDCHCELSHLVSTDLTQLEQDAHIIESIARGNATKNRRQQMTQLPKESRTVFNDVIDDLKANGQKYLGLTKEYDEKFRSLKSRWEKAKADANDSVIQKWWLEGPKRAQFTKEFADLEQAANKDLKQYAFDHNMMQRLERLQVFNKTATPEQKKKFIELLQCEWEPL